MSTNVRLRSERLGRVTIAPTQDQQRAQSIAVVETFFDALVTKDLEKLLSLWHADGAQEMPYAPEGVPKCVAGAAQLRSFWSAVFDGVADIAFSSIEVQAMDNPNGVLSQHQGSVKLANGVGYDNRYISVFYFRDGKIDIYREYFDPLVVLRAWGNTDDLARRFEQR